MYYVENYKSDATMSDLTKLGSACLDNCKLIHTYGALICNIEHGLDYLSQNTA